MGLFVEKRKKILFGFSSICSFFSSVLLCSFGSFLIRVGCIMAGTVADEADPTGSNGGVTTRGKSRVRRLRFDHDSNKCSSFFVIGGDIVIIIIVL